MSLTFDFNMNNQSNYSLSFLVDMGKTNWFSNGQKQQVDFMNKGLVNEIPKNALFNITSLVFNLESRKEEILSKYSCFYNQSEESFCIMVEETAKSSDFTREIMMNLMEFAQKLEVKAIYLLICRKNADYVKIIQGMMTVGFEQENTIKTKQIAGKVYKILKMNLKTVQDDIQEIEF